jgi:hypothetical protein
MLSGKQTRRNIRNKNVYYVPINDIKAMETLTLYTEHNNVNIFTFAY